jgi:hypothetical protein
MHKAIEVKSWTIPKYIVTAHEKKAINDKN